MTARDTTNWGRRDRLRTDRYAGFLRWGTDNRRWSPGTRRVYALRVASCAEWLEQRGVDIDQATRKDLRDHFKCLPDSHSSRDQTVKALRAYFRYLQYEEIRDDNPADWLPTVPNPQGLPKPLSNSEAARVLAAAHDEGPDMYAAVCLMLYAGLRAAEVCALGWSGLEVDGAWLRVTGKGARTRSLPVHDDVADALMAWRPVAEPSRWVFPGRRDPNKPMGYQRLHRAARRIAEAAGVEGFHCHRLRHTYGTALMNATGGLALTQDCLGHASPMTTRIYASVQPERMVAAVKALTFTDSGAERRPPPTHE